MSDFPRIRHAGDGALLLQMAGAIDPDINARVIAIARYVRERELRGVRDVVSTFRSVAVYFDPLTADVDRLSATLRVALNLPLVHGLGQHHQIPVVYGGEEGPDLEYVAARSERSPRDVIRLHTQQHYRVYMLGFQPGFAYMGLVDPAIATPRRETPRLSVPALSVGIAGRQTGIYPAASPGGWQIIGRAFVPVFDPMHSPPARFAPGDSVVFRASTVATVHATASPTARRTTSGVSRCIRVLRPGLFTTVQNRGRWGQQGIGVPVCGAMDSLSLGVANVLLGNDADAAALEVTIAGPALKMEQETTIALAGADLSASLDDVPVALCRPTRCRAGSVLRFGPRVRGARAYVAFDGGIQPPPRWPVVPLAAGETLTLGERSGPAPGVTVKSQVPLPAGGARLRVLAGPQNDQLPTECLNALFGGRFIVTPQSNRMGYRLSGRTLPAGDGEMISDATFAGGIQVPPSGDPILLMADRQTTGGYPQVATVIAADLPVAGQLAPGDWIEFVPCSREDAVAALIAQDAMIRNGR